MCVCSTGRGRQCLFNTLFFSMNANVVILLLLFLSPSAQSKECPSDSRCCAYKEYYEEKQYGEKFYYQPWGGGSDQACPANACQWGTRLIPEIPDGTVTINSKVLQYSDWANYKLDEFCACNPGYYAIDKEFHDGGYYSNDNARPVGWCHARSLPAAFDKFICQYCPIGSYCPGGVFFNKDACKMDGSIKCLGRCSYAIHRSDPTCRECSAGTYISNGRSSFGGVDPCSLAANTEDRACKDCIEGKFTSIANQVSCENLRTACDITKYMSGKGSTSSNIPCSDCTTCTKGKKQTSICDYTRKYISESDNGNRQCTQCETGKYTDRENMNSCISCDSFSITDSAQTRCIRCDAGLVADKNANQCKSCGVGSFQIDSTCVSCNKQGHYWNHKSFEVTQAECNSIYNDLNYDLKTCIQDSFQLQYEPYTIIYHNLWYVPRGCTMCPKGKYQDIPGTTHCKDCKGYLYQPRLAASSCEMCPFQRYGFLSGLYFTGMQRISPSECESCPKGTFWNNSDVGTTSCTNCAAGTFASITGRTVCARCSNGMYSLEGAQECISCKAGKYCDNGVQLDCPIGSISAVDGSTSCTLCVSDRFSPTAGGTSCQSCVPDSPIILDTIAPFGHKSETIWQKHA